MRTKFYFWSLPPISLCGQKSCFDRKKFEKYKFRENCIKKDTYRFFDKCLCRTIKFLSAVIGTAYTNATVPSICCGVVGATNRHIRIFGRAEIFPMA